ncbi:M23 family metallopeptidase [bacterium]|nr:M23 family metallopeptidase [bacterium]
MTFRLWGMCVFIFLIQTIAALAVELQWPLPDSRELTSGFGERRSGHFHGGIDIRTRGEILPCIAVDNGWVERVAVSPTGYGKTVYLRLPDGRTAVYAHLSDFAPKLDSVVRKQQLAAGIYRVDFPLESGDVVFERGETLAWTGATGIGAPHLHFEIRRAAVQLDPFLDLDKDDRNKPVVRGLRVVDASNEYEAGYDAGTPVQLEKGAAGNWNGYGNVREGTPFALLLYAQDPMPYNQHRPWTRVVFMQDGDTLADVRRAGIDLLAPTTVYALVDYNAWRYRKQEWFRLHAGISGNFTPFRPLRADEEDFTLDVYDAAGNSSRVWLRLRQEKGNFVHEKNPDDDKIAGQGLMGYKLTLSPTEQAPPIKLTGAESQNEITIEPELGFYHKANLTFTVTGGTMEKGAYLYERSGESKWFLATVSTEGASQIQTKISSTGTFGIAQDTEKPKLSLWVSGSILRFEVKDAQTGINDRSVRCKVDGQTAIAEYEPEANGGSIWTPFQLAPGEHEVILRAKDKVGNETVLQRTMTIGKRR